ncbi:hypothetical protein D3C80_1498460 [compost metagenome]
MLDLGNTIDNRRCRVLHNRTRYHITVRALAEVNGLSRQAVLLCVIADADHLRIRCGALSLKDRLCIGQCVTVIQITDNPFYAPVIFNNSTTNGHIDTGLLHRMNRSKTHKRARLNKHLYDRWMYKRRSSGSFI